MTKLAKNMYTNAKGERKLNCYLINIPKKIIDETDIKETDNLQIYSQDNKVIIEKNKKNNL